MKQKRWRLYDIQYKGNKNGPSEIIVNLDDLDWSKDIPIGFSNLNTKTYKAVKEVTGSEIHSCKVDTFYLD
jgi:hypothetical protein